MGFSETNATVNQKGIVGGAGILCYSQSGIEYVGILVAGNEVFKGVLLGKLRMNFFHRFLGSRGGDCFPWNRLLGIGFLWVVFFLRFLGPLLLESLLGNLAAWGRIREGDGGFRSAGVSFFYYNLYVQIQS